MTVSICGDCQVEISPSAITTQVLNIRVPADKSLTHRAVLFAAMANGRSTIENPSVGLDCLATLAAVEALGVKVERTKSAAHETWHVDSKGLAEWTSPTAPIDANNSGTTARLLMGLLSARPHMALTIIGDKSLSRRPMDRVMEPLKKVGGVLSGQGTKGFLPVHVQGQALKGFQSELNLPSAQVKSALLLAAISASGSSTISAPVGTRDHTERMMVALRAPLSSEERMGMVHFSVQGPWSPPAFSAYVPGDPSGLAFFAVLAFLHPGLSVVADHVLGNPGRCGYLKILERMGLEVQQELGKEAAAHSFPGEEVSSFKLRRFAHAKPLVIESHEVAGIIDEIPALAVACAFCEGESILKELGELRVKESDRLQEIFHLLQLAGVQVSMNGNDLKICGTSSVKGFEYQSDDHRMVMAASILSTKAVQTCRIGDVEAPSVSFPLFFSALQQIYG